MKNSNLFLISAPSGTGKSTLINSVLARAHKSKFPLELSISYTTRKPRVGETDSDHYFLSLLKNLLEKKNLIFFLSMQRFMEIGTALQLNLFNLN
jgi:guanylate kinase